MRGTERPIDRARYQDKGRQCEAEDDDAGGEPLQHSVRGLLAQQRVVLGQYLGACTVKYTPLECPSIY
eukprot:COSAG05_NODE_324_length_11401_cov_6.009379_4_plen_68_part_00